jgi:hypothetical protein
MEPLKLNMPSYPMLRFVSRHGGWLTVVAAIAVALAGIAEYTVTGAVCFALLGIGAGVLLFVAARVLVEMVRLMTDMLLPK